MRKDITFARAVREFRERHVASKRANTQRSYGQDLARLEAFFAGKRLSEIGPLTVEGYRKARTKGHTVAKVRCNREVALLRSLFARMAAWGLYEGANPIRSAGGQSTVGRYQESPGRERVLTSAEEARLLGVLREPYRTVLGCTPACGCAARGSRSRGRMSIWRARGSRSKGSTPRMAPRVSCPCPRRWLTPSRCSARPTRSRRRRSSRRPSVRSVGCARSSTGPRSGQGARHVAPRVPPHLGVAVHAGGRRSAHLADARRVEAHRDGDALRPQR